MRPTIIIDGNEYLLHHGDCIPFMATMPEKSVDLAIYSVPFTSLYSYTSEQCDLGNTEDLKRGAKLHFSFFFRQFARLLKPGRVAIVHCMQIPRMKRVEGRHGLIDFRGTLIRLGERAGLFYDYDWMVRKGPQQQALTTKSRELQFVGLESCRSRSRGSLCEYLIKFMAPGENEVPIDSEDQVSRNDWIDFAEGQWDIEKVNIGGKMSTNLNVEEARGPEDTRHICPLSLSLIGRIVRLYSNPGEIIFSPFAGIGSELYMALKLGRRALGIELKKEYHAQAIKNCERAIREREADKQGNLFPEGASA